MKIEQTGINLIHVYMRFSLLFLICLFIPTGLAAQDTLRTFIFGHSLINHEFQVNPTPSQETSVPHWLHFLTEEAGRAIAVSGQYGFLTSHVNLPPIAQWGFDSVAPAWDSDNEPFTAPDFDNILLTPANFVQYQAPTLPYFNSTLTPISATDSIFEWCNLQEDSLQLFLYENWPDMGPFLGSGFPPSPAEWTAYDADLNGNFHTWFLEYQDSLVQAFPNHCLRMIPVGPAISALLAQSPFDQIAVDTLYEDDAPHGRPTIYFMAAMLTYMAFYEEPAPVSYVPPMIVDSILRVNYLTANTFFWNYLQGFNFPNGESRVFCSPGTVLSVEDLVLGGQLQAGIVNLSWDFNAISSDGSVRLRHRQENTPWETWAVRSGNSFPATQFQHLNPKPGWNFYQLQLRDQTGRETYSNRLEIWVPPTKKLICYPNPSTGYIQVEGFEKGLLSIQSLAGKTLWQKERVPGMLDLRFLPAGIYLLQVQGQTMPVRLHITSP